MAWWNMMGRCYNKNNINFKNYGGRGIKVCERWKDFNNFYADMGDPPSKEHSIDRIDVNGDYCPENCRWVTWKEQCNNRRDTKYLEIDGQRKSIWEWSNHPDCNVSPKIIWNRLLNGWSDKDAVFIPKLESLTVTAFGETKTFKQWEDDKRCVVGHLALRNRIKKGMPPEQAITHPNYSGKNRHESND